MEVQSLFLYSYNENLDNEPGFKGTKYMSFLKVTAIVLQRYAYSSINIKNDFLLKQEKQLSYFLRIPFSQCLLTSLALLIGINFWPVAWNLFYCSINQVFNLLTSKYKAKYILFSLNEIVNKRRRKLITTFSPCKRL